MLELKTKSPFCRIEELILLILTEFREEVVYSTFEGTLSAKLFALVTLQPFNIRFMTVEIQFHY